MNEKELEKLRRNVLGALQAKTKCMAAINQTTGKKNKLMRTKFQVLNQKYWLLQEELEYYESTYITSDDEIEIKRYGDMLESMYGIYLKGRGIKVGHIDYRGYHDSTITGDIGYFIDNRFNGHNYAYKALSLLSEYLCKNDVSDFYISVFMDNVPSLKIILRTVLNYGGSIIEINDNMVTFECKTRLRNIDKTK